MALFSPVDSTLHITHSFTCTHTCTHPHTYTHTLTHHALVYALTCTHPHIMHLTHAPVPDRGMKPQDIPLGDGTGKISTLKARVSPRSQTMDSDHY